MRRQLVAGITASCILIGLALAAEPQPAVDIELETVLVVGEQPGPGLWKVSKGDHVMWVLAAYGPLPRDMKWRSQQIEARIGESQEVLYPGSLNIHPNIGLFRGLTLIPAAMKAGKNPDGAKLKQVLPPDTYARWLALREKYIGRDDDVEEWRPSIALEQLRGAAMRKGGLSGGPSVQEVVDRAAKKRKVRIHRLPELERVVKVEDPRGMLKDARKLETPDLDCFTRSIGEVEQGVARAKLRANAWSRGEITRLRELYKAPQLQDYCAYVLMGAFTQGKSADAANAKKMIDDLLWHATQASVQSQRDWVAAAQAAIARNKSTFAVLQLNDVFRADGHLEALRALGYTVEEPL